MMDYTRFTSWLAPLLPRARPRPWWVGPILGIVIILCYGIGAWSVHCIDANPDFAGAPTTPRQSRAVATVAGLILREVDVDSWTPNDPFFQPGWVLTDMPRYQEGIIAAAERFTAGMAERQGEGLSPGADGDLHFAAGLLKYPGSVWKFASPGSFVPTASAEKQYRRAARTLQAYNGRLEDGALVYDRSPEALIAALSDIAMDLGAFSTAIEDRIGQSGGSAVFNGTRGRLYTYSLLLRDLGLDYAQVIADRNLGDAWRHMLDSVRIAVAMDPWLVMNSSPEGTFVGNHLAVQGFYLLRVRQQLTDISTSLRGR